MASMDLSAIISALDEEATPLIRADFRDDAAWQVITDLVFTPVTDDGESYTPNVVVVDEPSMKDATGPGLAQSLEPTPEVLGYALLADGRSMREAAAGGEVTVDYVDLSTRDPEDVELFESYAGRTFRCLVTEVASIEANLSLANMDFHEFAENVGEDGVFRGF